MLRAIEMIRSQFIVTTNLSIDDPYLQPCISLQPSILAVLGP